MRQKIVSITIIIAVVGGLFTLFVYNSIHGPKIDTTVWNDQMTVGNLETAKYRYTMYTDIFCPYCDMFSDAIMNNWDEFQEEYVNNQNIFFEVRITDMNYEAGHSNNSRPAGEGAYCAAKQGKFWDYYHSILGQLYTDYHSKGIGSKRGAPMIPDLEMKYFYKAAKNAGLDEESFISCMENHETAEELDKNTQKASAIVGGGVPFFTFGKFSTSGFAGRFDSELDWKQAKLVLDAGLDKQN